MILIKVFDSWAKVQSGLLQGNSQNFGFFSACVNVRQKMGNSLTETVQGQHCMVSYTSKENSTNLPPTDKIFDWPQV